MSGVWRWHDIWPSDHGRWVQVVDQWHAIVTQRSVLESRNANCTLHTVAASVSCELCLESWRWKMVENGGKMVENGGKWWKMVENGGNHVETIWFLSTQFSSVSMSSDLLQRTCHLKAWCDVMWMWILWCQQICRWRKMLEVCHLQISPASGFSTRSQISDVVQIFSPKPKKCKLVTSIN